MFLISPAWYVLKNVKHKGRGAFATHDIPAGTVIGDYLGKIMKPKDHDEKRDGLYDMSGGDAYDILADPRTPGIHLINHSCTENCEVYPYRGHLLYFALRKIYKGEEITVNYDLYAPGDKKITCDEHACYCGSKMCIGTMHRGWPEKRSEAWERLKRREFGPYYQRKVPGKYGAFLGPLDDYPKTIPDQPGLYDIFGAEKKSPMHCGDRAMPSILAVRKRIRETGRQLVFPKLHLQVYGIRNDMLIALPTPKK